MIKFISFIKYVAVSLYHLVKESILEPYALKEGLYDLTFEDVLETKLRRVGFKLIEKENLKLYDVGPFEEDKFSLGKSYFDDDLTSKRKRVFYRKLTLQGQYTHVTYMRVVSGLLTDVKIKFRPTLAELKALDKPNE